jgi:hypothetical protein
MKTVNDMNKQELEDVIITDETGLYDQFDEVKFLAQGYTEKELKETVIAWIFENPDTII